VDDRYFISGSLDAKVRLWSIPDRQVIDWTDLNEMVTAASYTPDGQVRQRLTHWHTAHVHAAKFLRTLLHFFYISDSLN
jgi:WD40 repeat protein